MDANKVEALREAGYRIREACALCHSFQPGVKTPLWGTCSAWQYTHGKHTGKARSASVVACGWCSAFSRDDRAIARHLGDYQCLMDG